MILIKLKMIICNFDTSFTLVQHTFHFALFWSKMGTKNWPLLYTFLKMRRGPLSQQNADGHCAGK